MFLPELAHTHTRLSRSLVHVWRQRHPMPSLHDVLYALPRPSLDAAEDEVEPVLVGRIKH